MHAQGEFKLHCSSMSNATNQILYMFNDTTDDWYNKILPPI